MRTAKSSHAPASTHAESPPEFRPHPLRNNSPLSLPFPEKVLIANPASTRHPPPPPSPAKYFAPPVPRTPAVPPNIVHPLNRRSPASDPPPSTALHPEARCRPPHPSIYPIENANEKPPIPPALKPPLRPPHPGVPIYFPQPLRFPLPQPGMCKKVTKISNITLDTNSLISYIMFISWGG
jgi:hypothetical protein